MNERISTAVSIFRGELSDCIGMASLLPRIVESLGPLLNASRAIILPAMRSGATVSPPIEWSLYDPDPSDDRDLLLLAEHLRNLAGRLPGALFIDHLASLEHLPIHRASVSRLDFHGALVSSCRCEDRIVATILLFQSAGETQWRSADVEILDALSSVIGEYVARAEADADAGIAGSGPESGEASDRSTFFERETNGSLHTPLRAPDPEKGDADRRTAAPTESPYRRLVDNSDAILFTTDPRNVITFVSRRALDFFGVVPEDFLTGIPVEWFDLIHPDDRPAVKRRAVDVEQRGLSFEEEFRVINHITGRERWLLVKLVPHRDGTGILVGWDGFGIDITARRETQEALDLQSRKVRALYTVSNAIRGYLDPANIAARGLAALCEATGAHSGLCYLYDSPKTRRLTLIAHHGFAPDIDKAVPHTVESSHLFAVVADRSQSVVISDMSNDPRARHLAGSGDDYASAVIVPVAAEDEVFGALGLFHHREGIFDGGDVMLVSAAANQIGLAARQAHLFSVYRKQTKNLSALYRMSHELSHLRTLEETFQQAFTIIRDELGLKRLWLGLVDESGARIVGQAAFGPGWKRRLVEMNVPLEGTENAIRDAIASRRPVFVHNPEVVLGQMGMRRFFSRFAITSLVLVPLIARGQVLGVLAVQPGDHDDLLDDEELTLLSSLANEIGSLILTRQLEERIGEGERMRSAGLLAAGIAHNFNNLLQAVLGQASLLEMQRHNEALVLKAARIISESATKGAALVRQLLSFANLEESHPVACDLNELIQREATQWSTLLQEQHQLKLSLRAKLPKAMVDPRHIVRILTALITNAVEAMKDRAGPIQVFTDLVSSEGDLLHIEVPDGRYVRVGVRDRGIGMDPETKRRCFEPFFTTKNVDPGSGLSLSGAGLGLAAAYALARRNGGRLVVDSRPGQGSVFTVFVPLERGQTRSLSELVERSSAVEPSPPFAVPGVSPPPQEQTTPTTRSTPSDSTSSGITKSAPGTPEGE